VDGRGLRRSSGRENHLVELGQAMSQPVPGLVHGLISEDQTGGPVQGDGGRALKAVPHPPQLPDGAGAAGYQ
jgi:hypothetical protein